MVKIDEGFTKDLPWNTLWESTMEPAEKASRWQWITHTTGAEWLNYAVS